MENKILNAFFFLNDTVLNIKAFFEKDKVIYLSILYLNVYGIYLCSNAILGGILIPINVIGVLLGLVFTFLSACTCVYHFKKDDVFKRYREWKSNQNLFTTIKTSKTFNKIPHKDVFDLIAYNKDLISKYYSGIRRIGLVNDDISQSDFENLIVNCFIESEKKFSFNLEISANEVNSFARELLKPLLERIDKDSNVNFNKIFPFLNYKKSKGYVNMKGGSSNSAGRATLTSDQKTLYSDLRKM